MRPAERMPIMLRLFRSGVTQKEIARRFNISYGLVRRQIREAILLEEIAMKTRWRRPTDSFPLDRAVVVIGWRSDPCFPREGVVPRFFQGSAAHALLGRGKESVGRLQRVFDEWQDYGPYLVNATSASFAKGEFEIYSDGERYRIDWWIDAPLQTQESVEGG